MIQNEYTFQNKDQSNIFYHEWLPETSNIRAVIFIVHGVQEHSGAYRHVAEAFTQAGFACYGIDQRGHGKSDGLRSYFNSIDDLVDDLRQLFDLICPQYPDKNMIVFGHSMGSLVSLTFTLRYQHDVKALLLTGTAITGDLLNPSWLLKLTAQAAKWIPTVRISPPKPLDVLTTDREMVDRIKLDAFRDKGMWRIGTSYAMLQACRSLRSQVQNLTLPILALHGGADELTPSSGATYLKEHVQSDDITVKIYAGLRHEVVNEVGREYIIQEITDWLVAHA